MDTTQPIHQATVFCIGVLFQGIYQYLSTKRLNIDYFILYLLLSFVNVILYNIIFKIKV